MLKVALRGVLARKFRLALTGIAVLLGVTFVTTTYVLTDTLDASFRRVFSQSLADVDVVVRGAPDDGDDDARRIPDAILEQVRETDGVASARGFVQGYAQFVDRERRRGRQGRSVGRASTFVGGASIGTRCASSTTAGGAAVHRRVPTRSRWTVDTAREGGLPGRRRSRRALGRAAGDVRRSSGCSSLGEGADTGPLSFAAFDLPTVAARRRRARPARRRLRTRRPRRRARGPAAFAAATCSGPTSTSPTPRSWSRRRTTRTWASSSTSSPGCSSGSPRSGSSSVAFIIFNTFTILVTQRTRELGLLRAMGAGAPPGHRRGGASRRPSSARSRRVGGLLLGVVVARLLLSLVGSLGFEVPTGDLVVLPRTVVYAVAVGLFVTVGAALWPAIRAARIPPVAAMADLPEARRRRRSAGARWSAPRSWSASACRCCRWGSPGRSRRTTPSASCGSSGSARSSSSSASWCCSPCSHARWRACSACRSGWRPASPGAIARGNAMRNPRRTAATASALVIGLALVAMVAILGESAKAQVDASDSGLEADLVIDTTQFTGFSPDVVDAHRRAPRASPSAVGFRFGSVQPRTVADGARGRADRGGGRNGPGLADAFDLQMRSGARRATSVTTGCSCPTRRRSSSASPSVTGAARVPERRARRCGWPASTAVTTWWAARRSSCRGRCSGPGFPEADLDYRAYATVAPGVSTRGGAAPRSPRSCATDFPNIEVLTQDEARDAEAELIDQFLGVTVALLFLSERSRCSGS